MELNPPLKVSQPARNVLLALSETGLGRWISIGGAFALAYYLEDHDTHDIGAWWEQAVEAVTRDEVVKTVVRALCTLGDVQTRTARDVVSIELTFSGRPVFSFQIARRIVRLGPAVPVPWPPGLYVDSLDDLVAARMAALVDRGALRDFREIRRLCQERLVDRPTCWRLWQTREHAAHRPSSGARAHLAVRAHLSRIERRHPLASIPVVSERTEADRLRRWFKEEFLQGRE